MKRRFTLKFPPEATKKPITYHLIKDYEFQVNIIKASITEGQEGRLLLEVDADQNNLDAGLEFLEREGLTIVSIEQHLERIEEKCVHCGACTAACFPGALYMDRESWEVNLDYDKCIVCGLCVDACPLKIISVEFNRR